jgi:hypothetical protein
MAFHRLALGLMFVIEVLLPFGLFAPAPWSAIFGVATIFLMLAIAATGNFGFFNLLTIALCVVCFDGETARAFSFARFFEVHSARGRLLRSFRPTGSSGLICTTERPAGGTNGVARGSVATCRGRLRLLHDAPQRWPARRALADGGSA